MLHLHPVLKSHVQTLQHRGVQRRKRQDQVVVAHTAVTTVLEGRGLLWWGAKKKKNLRLVNETKHCVGAVIAIETEGVCSLTPEGEWEEITLALDSGAIETVIPPDIFAGHELREGALFKRGVEYEMPTACRFRTWESANSCE